MATNYFVEKRRQDKQKLLQIFRENPEEKENRLVAVFSLQTGYRLETVKRMIEELREAGLV
ncbi:MAG: hypothetical protein J4400_00710 [Candidatus Aenigmarchaeota archaeon]|nr:hypothetical protein [Candidatus Aenigmarchaeota archaeon]